MRAFVHSGHQSGHAGRAVFGAGTVERLPDEVRLLGRSRALLVTTPGRADQAAHVRDVLGPLLAGHFGSAAMHTPVSVTERALAHLRESGADCLVAFGGGSATGLSKALAARTGLPQIVIATTYAGSEATPMLGETADGVKTTRSSASIQPSTIIYDVDLTLSLPVATSVTSGVNAMAHAVEALYSPGAEPVCDALAVEALGLLARSLPRIAADPSDREARADALRGAWLSGLCLAAVPMGLHHKLCHTLGGSFNLPHAATHTVVLPHAMAYNASAAPEAMRLVARALDVPDAPSGMYDLVAALGGPLSLAGLGLREDDLDRAASLATAKPYPNPRELTLPAIRQLLASAQAGTRPQPADPLPSQLRVLLGQVVASFDKAPDPRAKQLVTDLVRRLHGFVADNALTDAEWRYAIDFLTRAGHLTDDRRQEFVLLSDTLGVSSAVDLITNARSAGATPSAVLGPFYVEGPPEREQGADIADGLPGTPLYVGVRITGPHDEPLPDAVADVWQSNDDGFYDVQLPDLDGPVLRARLRADADGRIAFRSILPSPYPIPDDGPVGAMLDAVGRHPFRAPHLHFMLSAPGMRKLITQLFVAGGAYIDGDTVFGVKDALVVEYPEQHGPTPDGRDLPGPWRRLDYTFRLATDD
ncbi:MAG: maleylacetate reductase and hydroxyquinol 1,2-dioxygenase domain-containing protein [Actinocrinis sp.]